MGTSPQQTWQPSGALATLLEPRVADARRLLGRLRYPVADLAKAGLQRGPGADLLLKLLPPQDFPLPNLRSALERLEQRLRDRALDIESPDQVQTPYGVDDDDSLVLDSLAGGEPVARATRAVYLLLRTRRPQRGVSSQGARTRALECALRFRDLCQRWLPVGDLHGPGRAAALHAWAQCYAREYVARQVTQHDACGPSASCDEAAAIALRMARRIGDGPD
ncbi:MAG: hypothetical protein GXP62_02800 [Oligoflexia bacterium]|nr:hypothetical protein [Oligoflexia bacterium]